MRKGQQGALLLELLLAISLFAVAVTLVAGAMLPFLMMTDNEISAEAHVARLRVENIAQKLNYDSNTYDLAFTFDGKLVYNGTSEWIGPGAISELRSANLTGGVYPTFRVCDLSSSDEFLDYAILDQGGATSRLALANTNAPLDASSPPNIRHYTMVFVGDVMTQDVQPYYGVASVYRMKVEDVMEGTNVSGIRYDIERLGPHGDSQRAVYLADGFDMADNPDQTLPRFEAKEGGTDILEAFLPNPFSARKRNALTGGLIYHNKIDLNYSVLAHCKGLQNP